MKTVLCYGDSNTWGANPAGWGRFSMDERWAALLRKELGDEYWVVEEGLNGRTTVWDDPIECFKSGKEYLIPCLDTHAPVDLVIIMLGTNDLKRRFSLAAVDIANGAGVLVNMVQKSSAGLSGASPKVLLMAPPPIMEVGPLMEMFEGGSEKSFRFSEYYRKVSEQFNCAFLDTSKVIRSSSLDGIHFEASEHKKLAKVVSDKVREIL